MVKPFDVNLTSQLCLNAATATEMSGHPISTKKCLLSTFFTSWYIILRPHFGLLTKGWTQIQFRASALLCAPAFKVNVFVAAKVEWDCRKCFFGDARYDTRKMKYDEIWFW